MLILNGCGADDAGSLTVSGAASLSDVLGALGEEFQEETGIHVAFNFGGSRALARQIELGAPADLAIFAGADPMTRLEETGHIQPSTSLEIVSNRLVLVARSGSEARLQSLEQLRTTSAGRIAVADPDLAPAGHYTREALRNAGLWDALESRRVPTQDVRAAAGAVASGNAIFGFVYATDAAVYPGVEPILEVPPSLYPRIVYPAAVLKDSPRSSVAERFLRFLKSEKGREVFVRHGFNPA